MKALEIRIRTCASAGLALLAAVVAFGVAPETALGRQGGGLGQRISCALASQDSFSTDDQRKIRESAAASIEKLRSSDVAISAAGREELLEPLMCPNVTVAFRAEFGRAVESGLASLAQGADLRLATNALIVMGKAKSSQSVVVLRNALSDKRAAIRLAAAAGYKDFLAPPLSGLPERNIDTAISSLGEALASEPEPRVAEILVAALDAARTSDSQRMMATNRMAVALAERVKAVRGSDQEGAWAPAILRGVVASRDALIQQISAGLNNQEFARNTGKLAAVALAYIGDRVSRGEVVDGSALDLDLEQLAAAVEAAVVVAHQAAGGSERLRSVDLRGAYNRAIGESNQTELRSRMNTWIGPSGLFTRGPYNMSAAELAPAQ